MQSRVGLQVQVRRKRESARPHLSRYLLRRGKARAAGAARRDPGMNFLDELDPPDPVSDVARKRISANNSCPHPPGDLPSGAMYITRPPLFQRGTFHQNFGRGCPGRLEAPFSGPWDPFPAGGSGETEALIRWEGQDPNLARSWEGWAGGGLPFLLFPLPPPPFSGPWGHFSALALVRALAQNPPSADGR